MPLADDQRIVTFVGLLSRSAASPPTSVVYPAESKTAIRAGEAATDEAALRELPRIGKRSGYAQG
jgi:hypothetical protein